MKRRPCPGTVAAAILIVLAIAGSVPAKTKDKHFLPPRATSGVDHIVVVMMENRSFDHLLGWHPTADGMRSELAFPDEAGMLHPTAPLAPDYMGCAHPDPDHSWTGATRRVRRRGDERIPPRRHERRLRDRRTTRSRPARIGPRRC